MTEPSFYPRFATGHVFLDAPDAPPKYTGSCAVYTRSNIVITAGHCVRSHAGRYLVDVPTSGTWIAEQVIRHQQSDIAVLVGSADVGGTPRVYSGLDQTLRDGGDFIAYGCPEEEAGAVGRFFKGHFQRYFTYTNPSGRSYFAGELSIPAPAGLSGGPVSTPDTPTSSGPSSQQTTIPTSLSTRTKTSNAAAISNVAKYGEWSLTVSPP